MDAAAWRRRGAALVTMTPEERTGIPDPAAHFLERRRRPADPAGDSARTERHAVRRRRGSHGRSTQNIPQVSVTAENYNRIARLIEHNVPVKLTFDVKTEFTKDTDSFNVIAEIPGTTKPNEVVMLGGHFDSWHYGTGATDNAAGSAVAMEAMRLLKSLNLKMDRTVRIGALGRRRRRPARLAALREGAFRRSGRHEADAGARQLRRLFQRRQRHGPDSRRLPAGQRNDAADFRSSGSRRSKI